MQSSVAVPEVAPSLGEGQGEEHGRLYHVVLLDDDEHSYDYVIEMLQKLFFLSVEVAFQHAVEVDTNGRSIIITCELPQAEFGRDQIQAYGADPRMPISKGSMSAVIIPAKNTTSI
jgi:ATP-dependent Clp protease adaptor protein ClpS